MEKAEEVFLESCSLEDEWLEGDYYASISLTEEERYEYAVKKALGDLRFLTPVE